jgi:hypothetical protein
LSNYPFISPIFNFVRNINEPPHPEELKRVIFYSLINISQQQHRLVLKIGERERNGRGRGRGRGRNGESDQPTENSLSASEPFLLDFSERFVDLIGTGSLFFLLFNDLTRLIRI